MDKTPSGGSNPLSPARDSGCGSYWTRSNAPTLVGLNASAPRECEYRLFDRDWGRGSKPAINIDWYEAKNYVVWLSKWTGKPYRLLSEAEWEYAARAGSNNKYFWGDEIGMGNANCEGCSRPMG